MSFKVLTGISVMFYVLSLLGFHFEGLRRVCQPYSRMFQCLLSNSKSAAGGWVAGGVVPPLNVHLSYLCFVPMYHREGMPVVFGYNFNVCLNQLQILGEARWRVAVP